MNGPPGPQFAIDLEELEAIKNIEGATEKQVQSAYKQALNRTAVTVKKLTGQLLKADLGGLNNRLIKKRFYISKNNKPGFNGALMLWIGLNPIPIRYLKGKRKRLGSKKARQGALFSPAGDFREQSYPKGFITKHFSGRADIYQRTTKSRFPVSNPKLPISAKMQTAIKDDVFEKIPEIFLGHFETAIKNLVKNQLRL